MQARGLDRRTSGPRVDLLEGCLMSGSADGPDNTLRETAPHFRAKFRVFAPDHQIFTRCSGGRYSLSPGLTLNALYQAASLRTSLTRSGAGAWTSHAADRNRAGPAQSRHDLHLRQRRRDKSRQPPNVGAGQGTHRGRSNRFALQGQLCLSTRADPAPPRGGVKNFLVRDGLYRTPPARHLADTLDAVRSHHERTPWAGNDRRYGRWLRQFGPGKP